MLDLAFSWLLLPLGVLLGWVLGNRGGDPTQRQSDDAGTVSRGSDGSMPNRDLDPDLQLALADELRRKGELDRAIAIHAQLSTDPQLSDAQRDHARLLLARDHLNAGLMDRAEEQLDRLAAGSSCAGDALELLLGVHERAREWIKAMEVARSLQAVRGHDLRVVLGQYACEEAERLRVEGDQAGSEHWARKALDDDARCVRASLALGILHEADKNWRGALLALRRVPDQDIRYVGLVLPALRRCCEATAQMEEYDQFLEELDGPRAPVALMLARATRLAETGGDALGYLQRRAAAVPRWALLVRWLELKGGAGDPEAVELLPAYGRLLKATPAYRCDRCGLDAAALYWQCPGCRRWGTVAPRD
jgi:Predicted N-acetylglucosaminyl transferase